MAGISFAAKLQNEQTELAKHSSLPYVSGLYITALKSSVNVFWEFVCLSTDEDAFTIQHLSTKTCLSAGQDLMMASCDPGNRTQLWKWASGHRLFHVGTAMCLALDVRSKTLSLVDCSSAILLWWRCLDGTIYTVYEMALVVSDGKLATKRDTSDTWVRGESQDNICQKPYRGECSLVRSVI